MARLKNKVALITGGSGGIGLAIAQRYANEGASVFLTDLNEDKLKKAVQQVGPSKADYLVADVTKPEDNQRMVEQCVAKFGGLDIFVANAGIEGTLKPIPEYDLKTFEQVMAVNVTGVWLGLKHAIPAIAKRGGGSIVVMASVAGVIGSPGMSAYIASKHASIGLMRTAALEAAPMGIRVNSINPGPVETRMMESIESQAGGGDAEMGAGVRQQFTERIPLKRYARPEEIADLALFLASDESSYITGQTHLIDGGQRAG
jgi:NAD(P)-dependent dehydrogenase (short-subunit alcohol dehydrogenase family)